MALDIVEADTTQENINRGIKATEEFFNDNGIIPHIAYKQVLLEAAGEPHVKGVVDLWDQAHEIAIAAAFRDCEPETFPVLVYRSDPPNG